MRHSRRNMVVPSAIFHQAGGPDRGRENEISQTAPSASGSDEGP